MACHLTGAIRLMEGYYLHTVRSVHKDGFSKLCHGAAERDHRAFLLRCARIRDVGGEMSARKKGQFFAYDFALTLIYAIPVLLPSWHRPRWPSA